MDILRGTKRTIVPRLKIITLVTVVALAFGFRTYGQTPTASPTTAPVISGVIGEVKAIDAAANQLVVRTDNSVIHTVNLSGKTQYKRMPTWAREIACGRVGDPAQIRRPSPRPRWS